MIRTYPVKQWMLLAGLLIFIGFQSCSNDDDPQPETSLVSAENALRSYLDNEDESFAWEQVDSYDVGPVKAYVLRLTSQQWREHTWVHQLNVLVPPIVDYDGAMLFVGAGSNSNGEPRWVSAGDQFNVLASLVALKNRAVTAYLGQVPNQPLYNGLSEDALISHTLHSFRSDGDYTWPLLFPMVKSAAKAMDAVQEFSETILEQDVNRFLVAGASKRGWTTWLIGATDQRVEAIAPMVIDVLNMPVSLDYQLEVWDDYSVQISDYVELGIAQEAGTPVGIELATMIDPYSYRDQLTMPKLIVLGTNDQYWPVDAAKNYLPEIPGQNFLHYVANAGHDLDGGEQVIGALSSFFAHVLDRTAHPTVDWEVKSSAADIEIAVETAEGQLLGARLWVADSGNRDFREAEFRAEELGVKGVNNFAVQVAYPMTGYRAFFVDLVYPDPNGGEYTKSTQVFVADQEEVFLD